MRPGHLLRTLVAALAVLLAGCTEPSEARFGIEPEDSELDVAAQWTVRLTLDEPLTYDHPGCGPELFMLSVATPNSTVRLYDYGQEPMFGACVVTEKTLAAGTHAEPFDWNGRTQGAQPGPHEGERVPAGTYALHAMMRGTDRTAMGTVEVVAADDDPTT